MVLRFNKIKKMHLVGIGGSGMSGIAEILLSMGYPVSGSDIAESPVVKRLRKLGAEIAVGHKPENINKSDAVIISSAIGMENPEVIAANSMKLPVIRRAEMLGELMRVKFGIAIAGTHGKTTTTSMTGMVLSEAGLDPTIIVGGILSKLGSSAKLGQSDYLVAEADEYDRSFLDLIPSIAVITNLEPEHMECYADFDDLRSAFLQFANRVPFFGRVVLCLDDPILQEMYPDFKRNVLTYGLLPHADINARNLRLSRRGSECDLFFGKDHAGKMRLNLHGQYNIKNALAALAVAMELDVPFKTAVKALESFTGVRRRFEHKGEVNGIDLYDDFAHHPTELSELIKSIKGSFDRRLVVIFQPHLYSRTQAFYKQFGTVLMEADKVIVTRIYPAREKPIQGVEGHLISDTLKQLGHTDAEYIPDTDSIPSVIKNELEKGDLVVTVGAGNIFKVGAALLEALEKDDQTD
ncbi:MAG: UDP-N-acetylmuramate--L-alanine ligase [candidate division Zixibacteria bacterium]|nr:UDP-N-acetylmuramate--L-alanine ligase [candidate division Zixibacteria bacterium]